jgi:hypothetical protein
MSGQGRGRQVLDGIRFAADPLAYLLQSGGRLPSFMGGGNVGTAISSAARPVFDTVGGWFGGRAPAYTGPLSRSGGAGWAPPPSGGGGYTPFNPAYSQAARAASPVSQSMAANRELFRQLNPGSGYQGAAHRGGNNGRLLGGGVLGSVWRQGGITFNDRQQTL